MITGASTSSSDGTYESPGTGTSRIVLTGRGGRLVMTGGFNSCNSSVGAPGR